MFSSSQPRPREGRNEEKVAAHHGEQLGSTTTAHLVVLAVVPVPSGILLWHRQSPAAAVAASGTTTTAAPKPSTSAASMLPLSRKKSMRLTTTDASMAVVVETLITNVLQLCPFFDALRRFFTEFDAAAAAAMRLTEVRPQVRYSALMHVQAIADVWEEGLTVDGKEEQQQVDVNTAAAVDKARAAFVRVLYPTVSNHQQLRGVLQCLRRILGVTHNNCLTTDEELGCCLPLPVSVVFDTPMSLIDTRPVGMRRRQLQLDRPTHPLSGRREGGGGGRGTIRGARGRGRYGVRLQALLSMDVPHPELDDLCKQTSQQVASDELVSSPVEHQLIVLRPRSTTAALGSRGDGDGGDDDDDVMEDGLFHWRPPPAAVELGATMPLVEWNRLDARTPSPLSVSAWCPRGSSGGGGVRVAEDRPVLLGLCRFDNGHPNHRGFLALVTPAPNNNGVFSSGAENPGGSAPHFLKLHEPDPIPDFITV